MVFVLFRILQQSPLIAICFHWRYVDSFLSSSEFFAIVFIFVFSYHGTIWRNRISRQRKMMQPDAIMLSQGWILTGEKKGSRRERAPIGCPQLLRFCSLWYPQRLGYVSESRSALINPYREAILRANPLYDSAKAHKGHSQYAGGNHRYGHILHCLGQISFGQLLANAGKYNQCQ